MWAHISPTGRGEVMGNTMLIVKKISCSKLRENEYLNEQNATYRENIS